MCSNVCPLPSLMILPILRTLISAAIKLGLSGSGEAPWGNASKRPLPNPNLSFRITRSRTEGSTTVATTLVILPRSFYDCECTNVRHYLLTTSSLDRALGSSQGRLWTAVPKAGSCEDRINKTLACSLDLQPRWPSFKILSQLL
jgi:hypothetical protein